MDGGSKMTEKEKNRLDELDQKNGYAFSKQQLLTMATKHEKAKHAKDRRTMEGIEYRLERCNYHTECSLLQNGKYSECRKTINSIQELSRRQLIDAITKYEQAKSAGDSRTKLKIIHGIKDAGYDDIVQYMLNGQSQVLIAVLKKEKDCSYRHIVSLIDRHKKARSTGNVSVMREIECEALVLIGHKNLYTALFMGNYDPARNHYAQRMVG